MAKITSLPITDELTGDEHLPIVQGTETKRTTLRAFRDLIVPTLQFWYKGDKGDTGPADNTYSPENGGLAAKASDTLRATAGLVNIDGVPDGAFEWKTGNFTALGLGRPTDYIASDRKPLGQGAWVRRGAESIRAAAGSVQDALDARPTATSLAAPAGAGQLGYDGGADAVARTVQGKLREIMVSITDYGAVANVNSLPAANVNRMALARAFAVSNRVFVPGTMADFFVMGSSPLIPAGCSLFGNGATLWMLGEGLGMGDYAESIGVSYRGIRPPKQRGELASGVPARNTPTSNSAQYAIVYINTKTGCKLHIPFLRDGMLNGIQANNSSYCDIYIEEAGNFGGDEVFAATEGAIVYAPVLNHTTIRIGHGWGSFGLGAILTLQSSYLTIEGKITDTRRGGISSAPGYEVGPGNRVKDMQFRRMGGITPVIDNPPANHWQSTYAVFWPGASTPSRVQVTNPDVEDWGETMLEGTMSVTNLTARITRTAGQYYDEHMLPPNPSALYGTMRVEGAIIESYRGRGYSAGGEEGHGIYDVQLQGMLFANPRPTAVYGAPEFVRVQPLGGRPSNPDDGTPNMADNVIIDSCVGFDTTGHVQVGFALGGSKGGGFTANCHVKNCDSKPAAVAIDPVIRQRGNSWQRQAYIAEPTPEAMRDAMIGAGLMAPA